MKADPYVRFARLERVVDGDTVDLDVDLGWHLSQMVRFRLDGLNTPELRGGTEESKEAARQAKAFVYETLATWEQFSQFKTAKEAGSEADWPLWVESTKAGKYGRWIAVIGSRNPEFPDTLNELLLAGGHAEPADY